MKLLIIDLVDIFTNFTSKSLNYFYYGNDIKVVRYRMGYRKT